ncbi:MAG: hypothetical protein ACRCUP_03150 [Mycoplasmatales bacterium]
MIIRRIKYRLKAFIGQYLAFSVFFILLFGMLSVALVFNLSSTITLKSLNNEEVLTMYFNDNILSPENDLSAPAAEDQQKILDYVAKNPDVVGYDFQRLGSNFDQWIIDKATKALPGVLGQVTYTFYGYNSEKQLQFVTKLFEVVEGTAPKTETEIMLPKEFADLNGFKVGTELELMVSNSNSTEKGLAFGENLEPTDLPKVNFDETAQALAQETGLTVSEVNDKYRYKLTISGIYDYSASAKAEKEKKAQNDFGGEITSDVGVYMADSLLRKIEIQPSFSAYSSYKSQQSFDPTNQSLDDYLKDYAGGDDPEAIRSIVFSASSPEAQTKISSEIQSMFTTDGEKLETTADAYKENFKTLELTNSFSIAIVLVTLISVLFMLGSFTINLLKQRSQEIEILTKLHEKKSRIIADFSMEIIPIFFLISFMCMFVISNFRFIFSDLFNVVIRGLEQADQMGQNTGSSITFLVYDYPNNLNIRDSFSGFSIEPLSIYIAMSIIILVIVATVVILTMIIVKKTIKEVRWKVYIEDYYLWKTIYYCQLLKLLL